MALDNKIVWAEQAYTEEQKMLTQMVAVANDQGKQLANMKAELELQ